MKLGVIIILYHPVESHIVKLCASLSDASVAVVLVDNSPQPMNQPPPEDCAYLHYPDNVGIAKAQNEGLRYLQQHDFTHALLLDQDSRLDTAMIARLSHHFGELTARFGNIAALGPGIYCDLSDTAVKASVQRPKPVADGVVEIRQIIASGMMLSLRALEDIGLKEEGLFIDGVDHEWCWRAQAKGYRIFQAHDVMMPHRQGDARKKVLGVTFKVGAPIRLYYQARNCLILARRGYVPLYWKLRTVLSLPVRYIVNRWCLPEGQLRGRLFLAGIKDGLSHKYGKLP